MSKLSRIKVLEAKIIPLNYGLRVVMPIGCFYSDEECEAYWTDEPPKGMEALYSGEPYKEVQHPDGLDAKEQL